MAVEHASAPLARFLGHIELPASIPDGDREYHQIMAMQSALQLLHCYSEAARRQARGQCVAHLIASLGGRKHPAGDADEPS